MCARYVFYSGKSFADEFGVLPLPDLTPSYNVAPTDPVAAVVLHEGERQAKILRWGLVPYWSKDAKGASRLINARCEGIEEKPSFRSAFAKRRCLLAADGFFEWRDENGIKQPYYLTADRHPFAFAGLYEYWKGPDGPLETCTLVTTTPNELAAQVHDRMPVILAREEYELWLDPETPTPILAQLLNPYPAELMAMRKIGRKVGDPRVKDESVIAEVATGSLFD